MPDSFDRLAQVTRRLRGPGGCPWDRQQTHASLKPYLLEEAYEVLDAIDRGDDQAFREELGDLLFQVIFHAQIAAEEGRFDLDQVVTGLVDKLIRRHPHVFGNARADTPQEVLRRWEAIKAAEREEVQGEPPSVLAGVPRALPALMEAEKVQSRAARVGFEWETVDGALEKTREELDELAAALGGGDPARLRAELGDLLFALVNVARYLEIDPELALRETTGKFRRRFAHIERRTREAGRVLNEMTLAEMDALWDEAKAAEGNPGG